MKGGNMLETVILTAVLTVVLIGWRRAFCAARDLWGHMLWWERILTGFAFLPIPGPVDEIVLGIVLVRASRRRNNI
jgi:hypothetical protein